MSLEGLDYVLNKQEVVPTVSADDLFRQPERVETDYRRHVRTYVPISRAAEGQEGALNVDEFVRRTIRGVKDGKALRGHLTADFGYGKTTTALYLWQKAEEANLIAVPPFQMLQLPNLVMATHGWVRHRLTVRRPDLLAQLDDLYAEVTGRSLEREAQAKHIPLHTLKEYFQQGRFVLELQATEYVSYFERITDFILQAGYEGLLVMPDEIQQYIEPNILRSNDPIAPFFNLLQAINTRSGYLKFGLMLVVPLKELGTIREVRGRGDVIARMNDVKLDLTTVYDADFATRLWGQLADEFGFRSLSPRMVTSDALQALGEIAARNDLSNGPRTVINVFRRIVERYKTYGSQASPYTPLDLVDDLLGGVIVFTGNSGIQNVTRKALQTAIVRQAPDRFERAVKLAAAFPTNGVPLDIQQMYGVYKNLDELMQQALGELVIAVGPIDKNGVTLFGLQIGIQQTNWLAQTIRDFRRAYAEHHQSTKVRALAAFALLLRQRIFKGWNVVEERPSTFTANQSLILEGEYFRFASRFPKRRVHVRILWEDEPIKDAEIDGDIAIEFQLSLHSELRDQPDQRRRFANEIQMDYANHTARVPLNLLYVRPEGIPPQVLDRLQEVWSPYDLSPLVLMNIYVMLDEKRADNQIPRNDDGPITADFQPTLLDTVLRDVFNAEVAANLGGVSQSTIVEVAIENLLSDRFGDTYHTLLAVTNWRTSISRYENALKQLANQYERRGEADVEGTKKEIAEKFLFTNPTLDNFIKNHPMLLTVTRDWRGNEPGAVRFTLHDLESRILRWLYESGKTEKVSAAKRTIEVHIIPLGDVYQRSHALGYRDDETEQIIRLLTARGYVELYREYLLRETPSPTIDLDEIGYQLRDLEQNLKELTQAFPGTNYLTSLVANAEQWREILAKQRSSETPDGKVLTGLGNNIRLRQNELSNFVADKRNELIRRLNALRQGIMPVNPQRLQTLEKQILGSVNYVDQVNAIRRAVLDDGQKTKTMVDSLVAKQDKSLADLQTQDVSIATLARCAGEVESYETLLKAARERVQGFEGDMRHLSSWQQLVNDGSELQHALQQMSQLTGPQMASFEAISRNISGRISSAATKISVLPDHAIYTPDFQRLRVEIRKLRNEVENTFTDLQLQYINAFTDTDIYRRDKIGRSIIYNVSNPDESYRQLYERVQELAEDAALQIERRLREHISTARGHLATPLFHTLATEDRERIQLDGDRIIQEADAATQLLSELLSQIRDVTNIRDFPRNEGGAFRQIIQTLRVMVDLVAKLDVQLRDLANWLRSIALTTEEHMLLEKLAEGDIDMTIDLVEWRRTVLLNEDEFWATFRSLFEKRRIRSFISRVRS